MVKFKNVPNNIFAYCETGNLTMVQKCIAKKKINFLSKKPDINIRDESGKGNTPLTLAIKNITFTGRQEPEYILIVKELLNHPEIDVNKSNNSGHTPLMLACESGHIETVELLLKRKEIDINQVDKEGNTAFFHACFKGDIKIISMFFDHSEFIFTDRNNEGLTPLHCVCFSLRKKAVELLLEKYPDLDINARDCDGFTPLMTTIRRRHLKDKYVCDIAEILLRYPNLDINAQSNETKASALSLVAMRDLEETGTLILEHPEIDVNVLNSENLSPYEIAYKYSPFLAYHILHHPGLKNIPPVAFEYAAKNNLIEILGKNKSVIDDYSAESKKQLLESLFSIACKNESNEVVQFLITDFDISNEALFSRKIIKNGLLDIVINTNFEITEKILAKIPDLKIDSSFYTRFELSDSLFIAILKNYIHTFKLLMKHPDAELNRIESLFGEKTLLSFACEHNRFEIIEAALTYIKQLKIKLSFFDFMQIALRLSTNKNVIKSILKFLTPQERLNTLLILISVCRSTSLDFVECLLKCGGFDINGVCTLPATMYKLPLNAACSVEDINYLKLILTHPDINVNTPVEIEGTSLIVLSGHRMPVKDDPEKVRLIINHPSFDIKLNQKALFGRNPECFKVLYSSDLKIDFHNIMENGLTIITYACSYGLLDKLKVILEDTDLDPNIADQHNRTPLMYLVRESQPNSVTMMRMLLSCERLNPEAVLDAYKYGLKYFSENRQNKISMLKEYLLNAGYD